MAIKKMNLPELSSRTMFYHLQMMNDLNSKISRFYGLMDKRSLFEALFLRKTYKLFFGTEGIVSN